MHIHGLYVDQDNCIQLITVKEMTWKKEVVSWDVYGTFKLENDVITWNGLIQMKNNIHQLHMCDPFEYISNIEVLEGTLILENQRSWSKVTISSTQAWHLCQPPRRIYSITFAFLYISWKLYNFFLELVFDVFSIHNFCNKIPIEVF